MAVYNDVVCPFCGCLCDDLQVVVEDNVVTEVKRGCVFARSKFSQKRTPMTPLVAGREVGLEAACAKAIEILAEARHPLIYGLSSTTSEAQKVAVYLAEILGGSIDSTASVCHGPGTVAKQLAGIPTCTLGEVKNRADLVVFWGCNPLAAHLRHFARYSVLAKGMERPQGRKNRQLVVVDVRETATARGADVFLQVQPNGDFEVLTALRSALKGNRLTEKSYGGIARDQIEAVAGLFASASYGVLFFGMGLTMTRGNHHNVAQALKLAVELNSKTRFAMIPMRGHGNVAGCESVLGWQTGYPFAVNFSRGYPRYNPGEYSATDLLRRQEVDAALIVASDPVATLPAKAAGYLSQIPTIVIDPDYSLTAQAAQVYLPSAPAGIGAAGTFYRMDLVPLPMKQILQDLWPSDEQLLSTLLEGVKQCSGSRADKSMTP